MEVTIRPLASAEERLECVRLQEATWGNGFADQVPPSILMIAQEMGGVASGAFLGDRLVGFVFGITGLREGRRAHWSDMLAVRTEHRGLGIGYRLKLHQRQMLLGLDVETVYWTFDPLVARNAHLNLRRLGAISRTYFRDLYGRSNSPLHQGIGTDRLLAEWWISHERVASLLEGVRDGPAQPAALPTNSVLINPPAAGGALPRPGDDLAAPGERPLEVAIPSNIDQVRAADPGLARAWRENVRAAFEAAFAAGHAAVDLRRGDDVSRYVLTPGLAR
jgi:chorismate synthase